MLNQRRLLATAIGLLIVTSQLGAGVSEWVLYVPHNVLEISTLPFKRMVRWATGGTRAPASDGVNFGQYEQLADNYGAALRRQAYLEQQLIIAHETIDELAAVRQHINMTSAGNVGGGVGGNVGGVGLVYATVASWSHANGALSITIDRGSRRGVAVGQAVTSGMNLVGRVVGVTPMTATVELVTSPSMKLLARVIPPQPGPVPRETYAEFDNSSDDDDRMTAVVGKDQSVVVGDWAHLFDETWPAEAGGCVIGQVVAVEDFSDDPLLRKRVVIEPMQTLSRLHRVVVLTPLSQVPTGMLE